MRSFKFNFIKWKRMSKTAFYIINIIVYTLVIIIGSLIGHFLFDGFSSNTLKSHFSLENIIILAVVSIAASYFICRRYHNINNPDKPPEILYKYAHWYNDHKKLITIPEIYFTSPGDFNDPYDCLVIPRYDKWSDDDFRKMWRQSISSKCPTLTDSEIEDEVEELIKNYQNNPQSIINEINRGQNSHFLNNIGVFSLSEIKESIIMWSHYANSHKGFCIGYDSDQIYKCIYEHFKSISHKNKWIDYFKNEYAEEYPVVIPGLDIRDSQSYKKRLKTKFIDWEYEKEWRLVVNQNEPLFERVVKIPIEAIAEVNLGFRMSQADIANIIVELKRLNYKGKIYKAEQVKFSYKLAFNEIIF